MLTITMKEKEKRQTLPPYDFLWHGIDLAKEIGDRGKRLLIPRIFLFGTELKEAYENKKRKQIEAELDRGGIGYLIRNPIIICAVNVNQELTLHIVDGHHRMRFSGGKFGIAEVPSLVCAPSTLVDVINRKTSRKIDEGTLIAELTHQTAEAVASFEQFDPNYPRPQTLTGISTIEQLGERFRKF